MARATAAATGAGEARFRAADAARDADVAALIEEVVSAWGSLDLAFNNAGIEGRIAPVHEQTEADFDRLIEVNLKGVFLGLRRQVQQMLHQGGTGSIVNTASIGGVVGFPNTSVYCATKHAVIGLTRTAALELARSGIRVNAVAPGAVRTQLLSHMAGSDSAAEAVAGLLPIGRVASPEEIAAAVVWLLSDASSYVTGHTLLADGGFTAQ